MTSSDLLGYVAGTLTTLAFVPQLVKTWRSRSVHDLSWGWLTAFSLGVFLWLVYGILTGAWPVVAANGVTLALTLALLALKVQFGR